MNKIYYVVKKQLDIIDGVTTVNGLAFISLYKINKNILIKIGELYTKIGFYSNEEEISDYIDEFLPEYDSELVKLDRL